MNKKGIGHWALGIRKKQENMKEALGIGLGRLAGLF
jgi:hypothetical protein